MPPLLVLQSGISRGEEKISPPHAESLEIHVAVILELEGVADGRAKLLAYLNSSRNSLALHA
jgi:hypothetical protein